MIGLASSGVNSSIFNITEEFKKFEFYIFPDSKKGRILYEKVRDEIKKDMEISDFTATDLQDEIIGPIIFEENRREASKEMENDKYIFTTRLYYFFISRRWKLS